MLGRCTQRDPTTMDDPADRRVTRLKWKTLSGLELDHFQQLPSGSSISPGDSGIGTTQVLHASAVSWRRYELRWDVSANDFAAASERHSTLARSRLISPGFRQRAAPGGRRRTNWPKFARNPKAAPVHGKTLTIAPPPIRIGVVTELTREGSSTNKGIPYDSTEKTPVPRGCLVLDRRGRLLDRRDDFPIMDC